METAAMLTQIGVVEISDDARLMFIVDEVAHMLAMFGGELHAEQHPHWWHMNDMLDDVIGIRAYLTKRLQQE